MTQYHNEKPQSISTDSGICVGQNSSGDLLYYNNDKLCTITQPYVTNDIPKPESNWDSWDISTTPAIFWTQKPEQPAENDAEDTKPVLPNKPWHDPVNHPSHYTYGKIETIDYIEDKGLGFNLGNAVKYISRAGHKQNTIEDLEKAVWYINREIMRLKKVSDNGANTAQT